MQEEEGEGGGKEGRKRGDEREKKRGRRKRGEGEEKEGRNKVREEEKREKKKRGGRRGGSKAKTKTTITTKMVSACEEPHLVVFNVEELLAEIDKLACGVVVAWEKNDVLGLADDAEGADREHSVHVVRVGGRGGEEPGAWAHVLPLDAGASNGLADAHGWLAVRRQRERRRKGGKGERHKRHKGEEKGVLLVAVALDCWVGGEENEPPLST